VSAQVNESNFDLSKLFRNVPFLTSIEMSPFLFSASFLVRMAVHSKNARQSLRRPDPASASRWRRRPEFALDSRLSSAHGPIKIAHYST
jgi:hypothetical protein